jgi:hypothetical protein
MIISHKHKFIFIKTNKTAGTSIEIELSKVCGPIDIITPIGPYGEKIRKKIGGKGPQNYLAPLSNYTSKDIIQVLKKRKFKKKYYNHIRAKSVRKHIGADIWDEYFKFCFERNPWDRIISLYYWKTRKQKCPPSISEFINSEAPYLLKKKGFYLYTINKKIAVDKICKFENISQEMSDIFNILNISFDLNLPRLKSKIRKDNRSYKDILSAKDRDLIAEIFQDEIKICGYTF